MIERRCAGELPRRPHTRFEDFTGKLRYEQCITRQGFDGSFTIVYHESRPHTARPAALDALKLDPRMEDRALALHAADPAPRLARRHYRTLEVQSQGDPLSARRPLLYNADVVLSVLKPAASLGAYQANGDADELYFIHCGGGTLRSLLGDVTFRTGDYLYVPRGLLHRFELEACAQCWLLIECVAPLDLPRQYRTPAGQLRMDAPYGHADFRGPEFRGPRDEGLRTMVVQRGRRLHGFAFDHSPLDAVGWDGALYPFAFSIHDFRPKVGRVHLPPTVHATFCTKGALICSFVPRLLDFDETSIACPYPHASVDVDEVLFYSRGDFSSRSGVGPASLSHHPAGIPHGPHPGRYETAAAPRPPHTFATTDELAVMMDCTQPLTNTAHASQVEDPSYHESFAEADPFGT